VQDQFPEYNKVVINSIFKADKTLELNISITSKVNDTIFKKVENATVKFYKDGQYVENLNYTSEGIYTSTIILEENHKYSCDIDVPNYGKYYCEDFLPKKEIISNIKLTKIAGITDEGEPYSSLQFSFNNDVNERKYYQIVIKEFNSQECNPVNLALFTDPILISEGLPILLFSNENIHGNSYEMAINYYSIFYSNSNPNFNPIQVEFRSISYNYYQYLKKMYLYQQGLNPSIETSLTYSNLHSNIEGGLGIFAGYSTWLSDTIVP
jgi:hypothetical protein